MQSTRLEPGFRRGDGTAALAVSPARNADRFHHLRGPSPTATRQKPCWKQGLRGLFMVKGLLLSAAQRRREPPTNIKFLKEQKIGWGARIRTWEWRYQKPLPYRLATPQCGLPSRARRPSAQYRIGRDHRMSDRGRAGFAFFPKIAFSCRLPVAHHRAAGYKPPTS